MVRSGRTLVYKRHLIHTKLRSKEKWKLQFKLHEKNAVIQQDWILIDKKNELYVL